MIREISGGRMVTVKRLYFDIDRPGGVILSIEVSPFPPGVPLGYPPLVCKNLNNLKGGMMSCEKFLQIF